MEEQKQVQPFIFHQSTITSLDVNRQQTLMITGTKYGDVTLFRLEGDRIHQPLVNLNDLMVEVIAL